MNLHKVKAVSKTQTNKPQSIMLVRPKTNWDVCMWISIKHVRTRYPPLSCLGNVHYMAEYINLSRRLRREDDPRYRHVINPPPFKIKSPGCVLCDSGWMPHCERALTFHPTSSIHQVTSRHGNHWHRHIHLRTRQDGLQTRSRPFQDYIPVKIKSLYRLPIVVMLFLTVTADAFNKHDSYVLTEL